MGLATQHWSPVPGCEMGLTRVIPSLLHHKERLRSQDTHEWEREAAVPDPRSRLEWESVAPGLP